MKDFLIVFAWIIGLSIVLIFVGLMTGFVDLAFLGTRTNMETHITRQTNAYITGHQSGLRTMKAQYDDLERLSMETNAADALDALHSQQRGIVRQMREEADLIPNYVQPDVTAFLASH